MNNKRNKFNKIDWESVVIYTMLITSICMMAGSMIYSDMDKRRVFYTPGNSLSKKERVAVDSLHNSELEKAKKKYDAYYQDYMRILCNTPVSDQMKQTLPHGHRMPLKNFGKPTLGEYLQFLKDYEQKEIERKYQELNIQLQRQK